MNKKDLKENVSANLGISKKDSGFAIDAVVEGVKDGIFEDGKVTLVGFGSLRIEPRKARVARNPKTGEAVNVPAKMVLKFKPARAFKDAVANLELPEDLSEDAEAADDSAE